MGFCPRGLVEVSQNRPALEATFVLLWSRMTIRVTRTAVSVVICLGPNRRPVKPFFRSSLVRSGWSEIQVHIRNMIIV